MKLRKLEEKDADKMLEWMHDKSVVKCLPTDFMHKNIDDCIEFTNATSADSLHFAIADDITDEYMGTVSLKHIYETEAEFAIAIRNCAMGKGYSKQAMHEMIEYGFNNLGLKKIYWCVSPDNKRAIRFYDKNGYAHCNANELTIKGQYSKEEINSYCWYKKTKGSS